MPGIANRLLGAALLAALSVLPLCGQGAPAVLRAWVDPADGSDSTGSVGNPNLPFRTIQVAAGALETSGAGSFQSGVLHLLPGRYGYGPAPLNGERWPVLVPAGVSLVGHSALSVHLEGYAIDPTWPTLALPGLFGGIQYARPTLVFAGASDFATSLVTRVTFAGGDCGVLVAGGGAVAPTVAFCAFLACATGVRVHSTAGSSGGQHAPKILNCTFGANVVGVAVTATGLGGGIVPSPARPALVNCLFRNEQDLEGVAAGAVRTCAFSPSRVNAASAILQPVAPTSAVFDPWLFTQDDLFLGALTHPAGPPALRIFTDWRLTYRVTATGLPNPAIGTGTAGFPTLLENGTTVSLSLPAEGVGLTGCTGSASPGPMAPGSPGWGIGYDAGASFHVGGTMPLSDAFGVSLTGVSFRTIHLFHGEPAALRMLLSTFCPGAPEYPAGSTMARGLLASPLVVPGIVGPFHLDLASSCNSFDLSAAMSPSLQGTLGGVPHWTVQLGPVLYGVRAGLNLQVVFIDAGGVLRCSNAEHVNLEL